MSLRIPQRRHVEASLGPIAHHTYRHYKGDLYTVEGHAFHHETREDLVVYRSHKNGWLNVRPLKGTPSDPDGWLTPVKDENGNERPRFQHTVVVLLLQEVDGKWSALCQASADMQTLHGETIEEAQERVRHQWENPVPLDILKDFPMLDSQFVPMIDFGRLHEIDPIFTWIVLDVAARKLALDSALKTALEDEDEWDDLY